MKKQILGIFILLLLVIVTPVAFADEEVGDVASAVNSAAPVPAGHFAIIANYADKNVFSNSVSKVLPATQFVRKFNNDGTVAAYPTKFLSDYYVIDVRGNGDYLANHVPGAVNVPFATIAKPENLATYPTDKKILVVCYTGHTASMTAAILNTLGFNAFVIKGGMSSWPCGGITYIYDKDGTTIIGYYMDYFCDK